jgi:hypothetical protein
VLAKFVAQRVVLALTRVIHLDSHDIHRLVDFVSRVTTRAGSIINGPLGALGQELDLGLH